MRRPIALTDVELRALLYVSNVSRDDYQMFEEDEKLDKRLMNAHLRVNAKLRTEARRRGFTGEAVAA